MQVTPAGTVKLLIPGMLKVRLPAGGMTHDPATQAVQLPQTWPQVPQLLLSVSRSMQPDGQLVNPSAQPAALGNERPVPQMILTAPPAPAPKLPPPPKLP